MCIIGIYVIGIRVWQLTKCICKTSTSIVVGGNSTQVNITKYL